MTLASLVFPLWCVCGGVVKRERESKKPTAFVIHFSPDTDLSEDRKLMRLVLYFLNSIYNIRLNVDVQ